VVGLLVDAIGKNRSESSNYLQIRGQLIGSHRWTLNVVFFCTDLIIQK